MHHKELFNMLNSNTNDTLNDIKEMMERSSKFISLNGFSGVFIGALTILIVSVFCSYYQINPFSGDLVQLENLPDSHYAVALISASILFICSFCIAFFLTLKRSKKLAIPIWGPASKRVMINFATPLLAGGLFCLVIFFQSPDLVLPLSLIFYGMALFNAGNFTFKSTKFIGIIQMLLGIFALMFMQYHIVIWTIGFGIVHIVYGVYMYFNTK